MQQFEPERRAPELLARSLDPLHFVRLLVKQQLDPRAERI
jgi:hypothetical protein